MTLCERKETNKKLTDKIEIKETSCKSKGGSVEGFSSILQYRKDMDLRLQLSEISLAKLRGNQACK